VHQKCICQVGDRKEKYVAEECWQVQCIMSAVPKLKVISGLYSTLWQYRAHHYTSHTENHENGNKQFCISSSIHYCPTWEANKSSTSHEISHTLCKLKVHDIVYRSPPSIPVLSQINEVLFCQNPLKCFSPSYSYLFQLVFVLQVLHAKHSPSCVAHAPPISCSWILSP